PPGGAVPVAPRGLSRGSSGRCSSRSRHRTFRRDPGRIGGANRPLDTGAGAARRAGVDCKGQPVGRRHRPRPHGGRWPVHHLDCATLRVLARAKGPERVILISDASPLAGLPAGTYGLWDVDPSGRIVVAGTPYLAGSNRPLATGVGNLMAAVSWPVAEVLDAVTRNPALLLGRSPPELEPGQPASLVVFRHRAP